MSDGEINELSRALGRIESTLVSHGELLKTLQSDMTAIKANGCAAGSEHIQKISSLDARVSLLEGVWRRAVLVMASVGVGSVGLKEGIAALINRLMGV